MNEVLQNEVIEIIKKELGSNVSIERNGEPNEFKLILAEGGDSPSPYSLPAWMKVEGSDKPPYTEFELHVVEEEFQNNRQVKQERNKETTRLDDFDSMKT